MCSVTLVAERVISGEQREPPRVSESQIKIKLMVNKIVGLVKKIGYSSALKIHKFIMIE